MPDGIPQPSSAPGESSSHTRPSRPGERNPASASGERAARGADALALLTFAAFAIVWTYPLVTHLFTAVPGDPSGDAGLFVWDFWWMREALASASDHVFWTSYQCAPFGTSLVLNTHVALPAAVGATLLRALPVTAAVNVTILAAFALNGFLAYRLARSVAGAPGPALLAGFVFAASPPLTGRLEGHYNLLHAWLLPLAVLVARRAARTRRALDAALVAAVLVAAAYTDCYYALFSGLLAGCAIAARLLTLQPRERPSNRRTRRAGRVLLVGAAACAVCALLVALTGGGIVTFGGTRVSLKGYGNLVTAASLLLASALLLELPGVRIRLRPDHGFTPAFAFGLALPFLALLPLAAAAYEVWSSGQYVSQRYLWRSGPPGVDVLTLVAGNPWHPWSGAATRALYDRFHIDVMESSAWLGTGLALALLTMRFWRTAVTGRRWAACGIAFALWSLGPWLTIAGHRTGVLLPAMGLRLMPLVDNARMPGRAVVVAALALAILIAIGLARMARPLGPRALAVMALLVAVDYARFPISVGSTAVPAVYESLRGLKGAVLELPVGLRDGFGELGRFDARTLLHQQVHARPIVGGLVARLPAGVRDRYRAEPTLRALLALSEGRAPDGAPDGREAAAALERLGVTTVVLDRSLAPAALVSYVEAVLPLERTAVDGERAVYAVVAEPGRRR